MGKVSHQKSFGYNNGIMHTILYMYMYMYLVLHGTLKDNTFGYNIEDSTTTTLISEEK